MPSPSLSNRMFIPLGKCRSSSRQSALQRSDDGLRGKCLEKNDHKCTLQLKHHDRCSMRVVGLLDAVETPNADNNVGPTRGSCVPRISTELPAYAEGLDGWHTRLEICG